MNKTVIFWNGTFDEINHWRKKYFDTHLFFELDNKILLEKHDLISPDIPFTKLISLIRKYQDEIFDKFDDSLDINFWYFSEIPDDTYYNWVMKPKIWNKKQVLAIGENGKVKCMKLVLNERNIEKVRIELDRKVYFNSILIFKEGMRRHLISTYKIGDQEIKRIVDSIFFGNIEDYVTNYFETFEIDDEWVYETVYNISAGLEDKIACLTST
jgi:hypothetical protein